MINRTLGAPLGGTTRGAHQALDCGALSLITPPNLGSGGGSCFPSMAVVAAGEPGGAFSAACAAIVMNAAAHNAAAYCIDVVVFIVYLLSFFSSGPALRKLWHEIISSSDVAPERLARADCDPSDLPTLNYLVTC